MNANTALKINDAIAQAIRCGETETAVREQVTRAIRTAKAATIAEGIKRLQAEHARLVAEQALDEA